MILADFVQIHTQNFRPHAGRLEAAKFAPKVQDLSELSRICIWVHRRLAPNVRILDMGSRVNLPNSCPNRDLGSWCILRGPGDSRRTGYKSAA